MCASDLDSVDKLFPENMIPDMLECVENLLHELGKKDWNQRFDVLPEKRKREIEDTARTGVPERVECLHWAVMNHAEVCPEDIALIDAGSGRSVSYGELKARATAVAAGISEKDIKGVPVALTLPRGIEQIEAALGILLSGNSYLPVSLSQPKDRRALIHEKTGVRYVVTNRELSEKLDWPEGTEILVMEGMEEGQENVRLPEVSPKDSAYIIMTSGSTGVPKGVEIAHESAWNTVQDINEKYHVTSADRALAVSAMDFDLSVYDVFGILGAGGTLVLLPEQERRNADYWLEQVLKYQITVWNSVPVLLDMLLIRAESMKQKLPIRAVMLSGDWIGMDLPQRVAAWTEDCQFVAMGGATEASIWSNYQNVTLPMPKNWKSIPYGKPLRYQAYRVVDEYGRDCPYWAEGELWIGGFGVAKVSEIGRKNIKYISNENLRSSIKNKGALASKITGLMQIRDAESNAHFLPIYNLGGSVGAQSKKTERKMKAEIENKYNTEISEEILLGENYETLLYNIETLLTRKRAKREDGENRRIKALMIETDEAHHTSKHYHNIDVSGAKQMEIYTIPQEMRRVYYQQRLREEQETKRYFNREAIERASGSIYSAKTEAENVYVGYEVNIGELVQFMTQMNEAAGERKKIIIICQESQRSLYEKLTKRVGVEEDTKIIATPYYI